MEWAFGAPENSYLHAPNGMTFPYVKNALTVFLLLAATIAADGQFYSGSRQEFGKNRVQYRDFEWQYYRFDDLETYFYTGGKDIAQYVAYAAHKHLADLQRIMDLSLEDRLQFIIYNSQTDFKQSNIGMTGDEAYNIGGVTRIVGTKIFVYYEGDHVLLDRQVRSGVARVMLEQTMYGGNWKEVLKNSTLLNLPEWYTEGFVSYLSQEMDADLRSRIKDGILSGRFDKFNRLQRDEARWAGHAVWSYVEEVYGESVIPNVLYMTRISRNPESGFLYVLGVSLTTLTEECIEHYKQRFAEEDRFRKDMAMEPVPVKTKKKRTYYQFKPSPFGRNIAYVSNELGQYRVYMQDLSSGKRKLLKKGEHKLDRIVDRSFPIVAWHPTGMALSYVTEKKGELYLSTYTLSDKKTSTRPIFMLEKVVGMAYAPDGQHIIFSGVRAGQTDLYLYYLIGNRQEQLTNDQFDDLYPRFVNGSDAIIFSSDRFDDTLRTGEPIRYERADLDLFMFNLKDRSDVLKRITATPRVNEIKPMQMDSTSYSYLADGDGYWNRYAFRFDSTISHVDTTIHYRYFTRTQQLTDLRRNILEQEFWPDQGRFSQLMFQDRKFRFYAGATSELTADPVQGSTIIEQPNGNPGAVIDDLPITDVTKLTPPELEPFNDPERVNIRDYVFMDDSPAPPRNGKDGSGNAPPVGAQSDPTLDNDSTIASNPSLVFPQQRNYNLNFATDKVLTQVDNSYSNEFYRSAFGAASLNPGVSGQLKMTVSDLFEDKRISGGVRLALNLNNNDYQIDYEDLSSRVDKRLTLIRQAFQGITTFNVFKQHTHVVKYRLSYPFSEVASLRATAIYRWDRFVSQSTDQLSLRLPNIYDQTAGVKLEYVFDNTLPRGLNLYTGWRYKVFGEYYKQPDQEKSSMQVVGLDIRHSLQVHRDIIWVNRLAGSSSFGDRKVIFFLGGVDNWLFAKVDNSIPIDYSQNYFYQTQGTPMRGFFYNARNGNSFAVANSELRIPLFKYLLNKPIRSDAIQNFQLIGFGDIGSAWTGSQPYADDNSFNTIGIVQNPLSISIRNQREPIIYSYGFGARTRLLGYYVRADWAWGVDDGVVQPVVFHFSLSLDI